MKLRIAYLSETYAHLSNGTTWPLPERERADRHTLEWKLRYGQVGESESLGAASYVHAWGALMRKPPEEREAIIEAIRRAVKRRRREIAQHG